MRELTPQTPQTPQRHRKRSSGCAFPISSPYTGKSPLPMPVLLPGQYRLGSSVSSEYTNGEAEHDSEENKRRMVVFERPEEGSGNIVPEVGSLLEDMPFFNEERAELFLKTASKLSLRTKQLKRTNDTVVELNESLGAYLFGLYQNAWCVNMNESISLETMNKLDKMKKLQKEVEELRQQLAKKNEKSKKDTRPILSSARLRGNIARTPSSSLVDRLTQVKRKSRGIASNAQQEQQPAQKKRTFLRAGSRTPLFKSRKSSRPVLSGGDRNGTGLQLSDALKYQVSRGEVSDDSLSSVGDTSEVQTLSSIRLNRFNNGLRVSNGNPVLDHYWRSRLPQNKDWQVKHRKPFR